MNPFNVENVKELTEADEYSSFERFSMEKLDKPIKPTMPDHVSKLPRTGGEWTGEAGNSNWEPDSDVEPSDRHGTNPEHKTWGQIKEEYGFDSVAFEDGNVTFDEVSKGTVTIDDFSDNRDANFDQADEKLAEQRGCTPEEVAAWRKEHKYTWHECSDCKTMKKVPTEVHGNISHSGGISEYKAQHNDS